MYYGTISNGNNLLKFDSANVVSCVVSVPDGKLALAQQKHGTTIIINTQLIVEEVSSIRLTGYRLQKCFHLPVFPSTAVVACQFEVPPLMINLKTRPLGECSWEGSKYTKLQISSEDVYLIGPRQKHDRACPFGWLPGFVWTERSRRGQRISRE